CVARGTAAPATDKLLLRQVCARLPSVSAGGTSGAQPGRPAPPGQAALRVGCLSRLTGDVMARYYELHDDENEDYLGDSEDAEPDQDDDGTAPCPYCGKDKWEESERCPHCGNYISREDEPSQTPRWIIVTAVVCLLIVLTWVLTR